MPFGYFDYKGSLLFVKCFKRKLLFEQTKTFIHTKKASFYGLVFIYRHVMALLGDSQTDISASNCPSFSWRSCEGSEAEGL